MGGLAWWRLKKWRWHALLLLTVVPVVVGLWLLQWLGPVGRPLSDDEIALFRDALNSNAFLPGILTLVAVLSIHVCVCLCGLGLAWAMLSRQPPTRPRLGRVGIGLALLVGLGLLLLIGVDAGRWSGLTIYDVSYGFFDKLYRGTGAGRALLQPGFAGIDALGWAVLIPTILGIGGVGVVTAAAAGELRAVPEPPPLPDALYEAKLQNVQGRLKRLLYVLTIGLVTSTVAVSLFFHLPSKLTEKSIAWQPPAFSDASDPSGKRLPLATRDKEALTASAELADARERVEKLKGAEVDRLRARLDDFAGELSLFWGAIFTLTLLASGAVPLLLLQQKVRHYSENSRDAVALEEAQKRLGDSGLLSGGLDQVKLLGAVVAPLASGPISHFVQVAIGGS
ncbi:MAG TPA: hypothetical protein VH331_15470 [Allosphingosinicella sp.]|jgi:hypothetical protein|nr:hypothetical protein [Allosphingosinicella sp.]